MSSISLFKMISCHAFYHKNLLINYKNSNPRKMNEGLISISRETFIFFLVYVLKEYVSEGKHLRANIYLSLLQLTTYFAPLIKKFTASMKVSKQIQKSKFPKFLFFYYFEMCEKLGRSGDQKLTIN